MRHKSPKRLIPVKVFVIVYNVKEKPNNVMALVQTWSSDQLHIKISACTRKK